MKVYNYDATTKDFVGSDYANPNPVREGDWLIPAHSTDIVPPTFNKETHCCKFINKEWAVTELPKPPEIIPEVPKVPTYQENRQREYPPVGEQLDALWKLVVPTPGSDAEVLLAKIESIKRKYPKN